VEFRASAQVHLREAAPGRGIAALAEELEAELVVMGSFSHRRDEPHHIGSTTERMITHFGGSLLLVRAR
jgi:nucleotide-binding universal stress UspA family protein